MDIELVIVSPLTRALQTASLAFEGCNVSFLVTPLAREQLYSSCDIGRAGCELGLEFPHLSDQLHSLPPQWWGGPDASTVHEQGRVLGTQREQLLSVRQRLNGLAELIQTRKETRIAVVAHGVYFQQMLGRWLDNCEMVPLNLINGAICACQGRMCTCQTVPGAPVSSQTGQTESALTSALETAAATADDGNT